MLSFYKGEEIFFTEGRGGGVTTLNITPAMKIIESKCPHIEQGKILCHGYPE